MNTFSRRRMLFFVVFLIILLFLTRTNFIHRLVYPFHYRDIIVTEARNNNQDPRLIASIIWVESRFKKDARSSKGAMGLMQIMPQTGRWVAEQAELELNADKDLLEPQINIAIGAWYLQNLVKIFDENTYAALAAYNGGQGHVKRWLDSGIWDGTLENIDQIPFPETRQFIIKVDRTYERYKEIYSL